MRRLLGRIQELLFAGFPYLRIFLRVPQEETIPEVDPRVAEVIAEQERVMRSGKLFLPLIENTRIPLSATIKNGLGTEYSLIVESNKRT